MDDACIHVWMYVCMHACMHAWTYHVGDALLVAGHGAGVLLHGRVRHDGRAHLRAVVPRGVVPKLDLWCGRKKKTKRRQGET